MIGAPLIAAIDARKSTDQAGGEREADPQFKGLDRACLMERAW